MHPSDNQRRGDNDRFVARPRKERRRPLESETRKTLQDLRGLYVEAQEIVAEGRDSFFAEDNRRTRRAATALIIHLSDAAQRKEIVTIANSYPDVDWSGVKKQRDHLGHRYHDIDFEIVWKTISEFFPRERKILGLD